MFGTRALVFAGALLAGLAGSAQALPAPSLAGQASALGDGLFASVLNTSAEAAIGGTAPEVLGCINFRSFPSQQVYRSTLRPNSRYRLRVVPDRGGFNVVMTLDFGVAPRRLFRVVNQKGPGRPEVFTINTLPGGAVSGRVTITGVGGSFGCFNLTLTKL